MIGGERDLDTTDPPTKVGVEHYAWLGCRQRRLGLVDRVFHPAPQ